MSTYVIVSERVGKPGDTYTPEDGVNIDALIEFGFIKHAGKSAVKITNDDSEQE